jgi:hypothetical protein
VINTAAMLDGAFLKLTIGRTAFKRPIALLEKSERSTPFAFIAERNFMTRKRFSVLCGVILVALVAFILSLARAPSHVASSSPQIAAGRAPIERVGTPTVRPAPVAIALLAEQASPTPTTANTVPDRLQDAVAPPPMAAILPPDLPDPARPPQGTQPLAVPEPPVAPDPFVLPAIAVDEHVRYTRGTPVPADLYAPEPASAAPESSN